MRCKQNDKKRWKAQRVTYIDDTVTLDWAQRQIGSTCIEGHRELYAAFSLQFFHHRRLDEESFSFKQLLAHVEGDRVKATVDDRYDFSVDQAPDDRAKLQGVAN